MTVFFNFFFIFFVSDPQQAATQTMSTAVPPTTGILDSYGCSLSLMLPLYRFEMTWMNNLLVFKHCSC